MAMAVSKVVNLDEYQLLAKQKMPKMFYDFYAGGTEDLWTLKENRQAFLRIRIRPRVLVDVSNVDMSTIILGFKVPFPIMIAPTALHKMAHPEGEVATARAAAATKAIMVLSTSSSTPMEEVAAACPGIRLFQLYIFSKAKTLELIQRAEQAGYKALVLTVDTPLLGRREDDLRNRLVLSPSVSMKHLEDIGDMHTKPATLDSNIASFAGNHMSKTVTWKDIQWLKSITSMPILLKGILTREAAEKAVLSGVSGIIVSNHGGRQLDHVHATISVLEEVVAAVGGKMPVYIDGGIRRGTDVFKALALGASGVLIGRPVLFGLAVDGEQGVIKVVEMLRDELKTTMSLAGCPTLRDITRKRVELSMAKL